MAEWPQNWSGHFGEGTNLLPLPGCKHRTVQPEAWSVYRLRYPSSQLQMATVKISTYISPAVTVNNGKKPLYIYGRTFSDPLSNTSCTGIVISQFCSSYLNCDLSYGGWLNLERNSRLQYHYSQDTEPLLTPAFVSFDFSRVTTKQPVFCITSTV